MKVKQPMVNIILPTYNGEKYLCELLDSLLKQSYENIKIWIRDDKSTDKTTRIITSYKNKYEDIIEVINEEKKNLGVSNNILSILRKVDGDYFMLCDQDDKWFSNKVAVMLKTIRVREKVNRNRPILVFCDAVVTNDKLKVISNSFIKYEGIDIRRVNFSNFLQANIVQGASCIFNKELLNVIRYYRKDSLKSGFMYDWWIATLASAFGNVYYVNKPLMYYRQHNSNVIGAKKSNSILKSLILKDEKEINRYKMRNYTTVNRGLCQELLRCYDKYLSDRQKEIIKIACNSSKEVKKFYRLKLYKDYSIKQLLMKAFLKKGIYN